MKKNVKINKKIAIVSTVIVIIAIVVATIMGTEYGKFLFIPSVKNKQIDELDLKKYNKLMIVAHPDDELIWGGAHLLEDDYLVVCITRGYDKTRKKEFENVIKATGDKGIILSYPDKIAGQRSNWGRWKKDIEKDILEAIFDDSTRKNCPAYLIGQLARSEKSSKGSGVQILTTALEYISEASDIVGGRLIYLDCVPDKEQYYKDNGFKILQRKHNSNLIQMYRVL